MTVAPAADVCIIINEKNIFVHNEITWADCGIVERYPKSPTMSKERSRAPLEQTGHPWLQCRVSYANFPLKDISIGQRCYSFETEKKTAINKSFLDLLIINYLV